MLVIPKQGWQNFIHSKDLLNFISETLVSTTENIHWEHFQISECALVWCSGEIDSTNQIQIEWKENGKNSLEIRSLGIEMTNNGGSHFKQLFRLKRELKKRFGLNER